MIESGTSPPAAKFSGHRVRFAAFAVWGLLLAGCLSSISESKLSPARRDINAVVAAHNEQLMAIPGVVGVYVGLLDDAVTPCLKVMLSRDDPTLSQTLPEMLEGYRVVPEVTGEIRPMGKR